MGVERGAGDKRGTRGGLRSRGERGEGGGGGGGGGGGLAELDEFLADGDHDGFHAGVDLELLQDVPHVVLHGVLGNEELLGDVTVVHAGGHELEHLHLPVGELRR